VQLALTVYEALAVVLELYGNNVETLCAIEHNVVVGLQNVTVFVPAGVKTPPVPTIEPVQVVAFNAWNEKLVVSPLALDANVTAFGTSGDAGPNVTGGVTLVTPQPVPVPPLVPVSVADACSCPGVEFDDICPVWYVQELVSGMVILMDVCACAKAHGSSRAAITANRCMGEKSPTDETSLL